MPMYNFQVDDGTHATICEALYLKGPDDVRNAVLSALPEMARDTMPNGDRRVIRASATDEAGNTIYSATLTLAGSWGSRE